MGNFLLHKTSQMVCFSAQIESYDPGKVKKLKKLVPFTLIPRNLQWRNCLQLLLGTMKSSYKVQ